MIIPVEYLILYFHLSGVDSADCCYDKATVQEEFYFDESLYEAFLVDSKWPTNKIYYDIDAHMDPVIRHYVAQAIDYFNNQLDTCVVWEQHYPHGLEDPRKHWVTFVQLRDKDNPQLHADLGYNLVGFAETFNTHIYIGYEQSEITLSGNLLWGNTHYPNDGLDDKGLKYMSHIIHEMMHAMSFNHEHQRRDRDCWVYVSDDFILDNPGSYERLFEGGYYSIKFPYDLNSVMHYATNRPNLYAHVYPTMELGRKDGELSEWDLMKLNYVYCDGPAYCDSSQHCATHLRNYQHEPTCFREGPVYNYTPLTCGKCPTP